VGGLYIPPQRRIIQCADPAKKRPKRGGCLCWPMNYATTSRYLFWDLGHSLLRLVPINHHNCHDNRHDNEDDDANEQAPPLLAVARARTDDCGANLLIAFHDIVVDFFGLGLDARNLGFLLLHDLVKVLEELGQLDHLALNVLDRGVALLHVTEAGAGLAAAVGAEELGVL
jgi:hypothetical protein